MKQDSDMTEASSTPAPTRRRGLPWWAWALIALGVVVILIVPVMTVVGFFAYARHSVSETSPDQPFISGPRQQPAAKTPLACPEACFTIDAATLMAVSADDVSQLSIKDELYAVGEIGQSTVSEVAPRVGEQWLSVDGDEECSFVPVNAPYIPVGPDSSSEDPISWVQTWETGDEMTDISARVFATTDAASAFMSDIHQRVAACPWQDLNVPAAGGLDTSLLQITAQAAIDVPGEVAAVGWVREGDPGPRWRAYVWELQRGNLVVQMRVLTDGRIVEEQVATYAEFIAERLGRLQAGMP